MVKQKEVSTVGSKVKKGVIWTFSIIGILAVLIVVWAVIDVSSSDDNINTIQNLEASYLKNYNLFSTEYSIADPGQVTSLATLPRAKKGAEDAKFYLSMVKDNITDILELTTQIKGEYSDTELEWINKNEECYKQDLDRTNLYEEILNNELVYFNYYENEENYFKSYEEFLISSDSYLYNSQSSNKQGMINDLNKMKTQVSAMKTYAKGAYDAIPFVFFQKREIWADKYNQALDLELKYWASPSPDTLKQASDKFNDANRALEGVTDSSVKEEFGTWYNEKITLKIDEAERRYNTLDSTCSEARDLFLTAFPGNANVIKDVEVSKAN